MNCIACSASATHACKHCGFAACSSCMLLEPVETMHAEMCKVAHKFRDYTQTYGSTLSNLRSQETSEYEDALYDIYSGEPSWERGNRPRPDDIYNSMRAIEENIRHGLVLVKGAPRDLMDGPSVYGMVQRRNNLKSSDHLGRIRKTAHIVHRGPLRDFKEATPEHPFSTDMKDMVITNRFYLAYSIMGPERDSKQYHATVLLHHGVPANRLQQLEVGKRLAMIGLTVVLIDFLGMGQSDKPLFYGDSEEQLQDVLKGKQPIGELRQYEEYFKWNYDVPLIREFAQKVIRDKFYYFSDDWGAGPCMHYAARYGSKDLLGFGMWDPIALDGYPVHEIQAIGRAANGPATAASAMAQLMGQSNNTQLKNGLHQLFFQMGFAAADQTMDQIYKTMVEDSTNFSNYTFRVISHPYTGANYVMNDNGEKATSQSMQLKWHALWVLAQRASVLGSELLLPYHRKKNPYGVRYLKIDVDFLIMWGDRDNMMPPHQRHRLAQLVGAPRANAPRVTVQTISNAGHFAAVDKPDEVAENLAHFILDKEGRQYFAPFFGFYARDHWKGDEEEVVNDLRKLWGKMKKN